MAEVGFDDVPIRLLGAPSRHSFVVLPQRISVVLRGGVESIAKLLPENISVAVDYDEVVQSTTGTLRPRVNAPSDIQVIRISPQFLHCGKRILAARNN